MNQNLVKTSPTNTPLIVPAFKAKEQIETKGVKVYEAIIQFGQSADNLVLEKSSAEIGESAKSQRDLQGKRNSNLMGYWNEGRAILPNITVFVNKASVSHVANISGIDIVELTIDSDADRHITDGQNRTKLTHILSELDDFEKWKDYTLAMKVVVTDTEHLQTPEAQKIIRQVFADYHKEVAIPNKSINNFFDSSKPFSRLCKDLLDIEYAEGKTVMSRVSTQGIKGKGVFMVHAEFCNMVAKFLGGTPTKLNTELKDEQTYAVSLKLTSNFIKQVFNLCPIETLDGDDHSKVRDKAMFTKAIFTEGLGLLGDAIIQAKIKGNPLADLNLISTIDAPIDNMEHKVWLEEKITHRDGSIKIMKGSAKKVAIYLCSELGLPVSKELRG